MPAVKVPENLPDLVRSAFGKARQNGDLTYYPTHVTVLSVRGVPFQLRFSPALASKPKAPIADKGMVDARSVDPFENPPQALRIASLPPDHFLVLNKFAVVPEHFILATTAFKPQTHLLEAADLAAVYACIEAYHGAGQELFAFFNSGDHSGASQPHRHIQMLPVERMRDGLNACEDGAKWELLAERLVGEDLSLPFTTFAESLRPDVSPDSLRDIYLSLYRKACAASDVNAEGSTEGEARICYNVGMTRNVMALCPRTAEGSFIRAAPDKLDKVGNVAMNGTVLAGTALVKGQEEWEALRNDPEQLAAILSKIGIPTSKTSG